MGKRAISQEDKKHKSEMILNTAEIMFLESDYEKMKMADIAKKVGISNGLIFVYFKTKETLFLNLLEREYVKRFCNIKDLIQEFNPMNYQDLQHVIMLELEKLIDDNPLYIRLESIRSSILEKNTDVDMLLEIKQKMHYGLLDVALIIEERHIMKKEQAMNLFLAEAVIITGTKLLTDIPENASVIIEKYQYTEFQREIKKDLMFYMQCYLQGYEKYI